MADEHQIKYAFFGTSQFSLLILDELEKAGLIPALIVTAPDKPRGRGLELQPTPVKEWALKRNIETLEPAVLGDAFIQGLEKKTGEKKLDVFIVASYGKILPASLIEMRAHKTLNVHPSLLPKYRGATPMQSAMLDDAKETGVAIIRLDEKMDHGPIVAEKKVGVDEWPTYEDFETLMAREGGQLLAHVLPEWIAGKIVEKEQDHSQATFAKKITKGDGLIDVADLNSDAPTERQYAAFRKIQAFHRWPTAYFFIEKKAGANGAARKIRVKIARASFRNGKLTIERVVPEGSKEMAYADFLKGF